MVVPCTSCSQKNFENFFGPKRGYLVPGYKSPVKSIFEFLDHATTPRRIWFFLQNIEIIRFLFIKIFKMR